MNEAKKVSVAKTEAIWATAWVVLYLPLPIGYAAARSWAWAAIWTVPLALWGFLAVVRWLAWRAAVEE